MSHPIFPSRVHAGSASRRYSAKNNTKPINFVCLASHARHVSVIGDFNDWNPRAHPMKRQPDGAWIVQIPLNHGPNLYLFWIDGTPTLDPRARGTVRNERNEKVSLITIS